MTVGTVLDLDVLRSQRCVAIIRAASVTHFAVTAAALVDEGVGILEFPLTTPGALRALPPIVESLGARAYVGVGTVTTVEQASAAHRAGAAFLVTPNHDPAVIAYARGVGLPILAGAFSPTEVFAAWRAGATAVKLFPASLGGPRYLRELTSGPFPDIPIVPTGGVEFGDVPAYLDAGAVAFGLGGALLGGTADHGDCDDLRNRVRQFRSAITR